MNQLSVQANEIIRRKMFLQNQRGHIPQICSQCSPEAETIKAGCHGCICLSGWWRDPPGRFVQNASGSNFSTLRECWSRISKWRFYILGIKFPCFSKKKHKWWKAKDEILKWMKSEFRYLTWKKVQVKVSLVQKWWLRHKAQASQETQMGGSRGQCELLQPVSDTCNDFESQDLLKRDKKRIPERLQQGQRIANPTCPQAISLPLLWAELLAGFVVALCSLFSNFVLVFLLIWFDLPVVTPPLPSLSKNTLINWIGVYLTPWDW